MPLCCLTPTFIDRYIVADIGFKATFLIVSISAVKFSVFILYVKHLNQTVLFHLCSICLLFSLLNILS